MSNKLRTAVLCAADSAEKIRTCDAWRVYDKALELGVVFELKRMLERVNKPALAAMCEYEADEIMAKIEPIN